MHVLYIILLGFQNHIYSIPRAQNLTFPIKKIRMVFGIYKAVILLLKNKFDKILIELKNMIFYIKKFEVF